MKFKEDFTYVISKTLSGNKLLIGTKNNNSYLELKKEYFNSFFNLVSIINNSNLEYIDENKLEQKERELLSVFYKKCFIGENTTSESSFNEVTSMITIFYKKKLSNCNLLKVNRKSLFSIVYAILFTYFSYYVLSNIFNINLKLTLNDFSTLQIGMGICLFPLVIFIHELGHFVTAQMVGVQVKSITIGWMITHPIVYLDYQGLNLNHTYKKLIVISGGIFSHLIFASLGILLLKYFGFNPLITLLTLCNVSMIITNLLFLGPSDGYFFLTNLLGIYNLRYRGYRSIKSIFAKRSKRISNIDKISGITIVLLLLISLKGIFESIFYLCTILSISIQVSTIISSLIVVLFGIRVLFKITKLQINNY